MTLDPRLTLRQLEQFVAVADAGGFAPAAAALHLTPNAVAQSVSELERILETQLCVRRRARGVTLTAAGTRLAQRSRSVLRAASELPDVADDEDSPSGTVRLGCYGPLAPSVLPRLWTAARRALPRVDLQVDDAGVADASDALLRGALDATIAYAVHLPDGLAHHRIGALPLRVALPGGHPLAAAAEVDLADLAEEPLVLLDSHPSGENTMALLRRRGVAPRVGHRVHDIELMRGLVAHGAGWGLHFTAVASEVSRDGLPVVSRPVAAGPGGAEHEEVVVAWHADLPPTPRVAAVLRLLEREFGGAGDGQPRASS